MQVTTGPADISKPKNILSIYWKLLIEKQKVQIHFVVSILLILLREARVADWVVCSLKC